MPTTSPSSVYDALLHSPKTPGPKSAAAGSLLSLPVPVHAAALLQRPATPAWRADTAASGQERRQWIETFRLLQQRADALAAELPASGCISRMLSADTLLKEDLQPVHIRKPTRAIVRPPVLCRVAATGTHVRVAHRPQIAAEAEALQQQRHSETKKLRERLQAARQATLTFGALILHVGAGPEYLEQLQRVIEHAEEKLRSLRADEERCRRAPPLAAHRPQQPYLLPHAARPLGHSHRLGPLLSQGEPSAGRGPPQP